MAAIIILDFYFYFVVIVNKKLQVSVFSLQMFGKWKMMLSKLIDAETLHSVLHMSYSTLYFCLATQFAFNFFCTISEALQQVKISNHICAIVPVNSWAPIKEILAKIYTMGCHVSHS